MEPHLPTLIPFLFDSLKHEKVNIVRDLWRLRTRAHVSVVFQPLVRSIACWTLGRYSAWCIPEEDDPEHKQRFFEPTIQGVSRSSRGPVLLPNV